MADFTCFGSLSFSEVGLLFHAVPMLSQLMQDPTTAPNAHFLRSVHKHSCMAQPHKLVNMS